MSLRGIFPYIEILHSGMLVEYGWFKSRGRYQAIDANNDPIPWFTYAAIEFLSSRVRSNMNVFEYGCGNGTLWWAKKINRIYCVEHDSIWFERIQKKVPANVELSYCDLDYDGNYCKAICNYGIKFDIVIVDGRDRVNCVKASVDYLKNDGVLILDDSNREKYSGALSELYMRGFRRIEFKGLGPISKHICETSIFYRNDNILRI
jgi:precorrin-6B methylase 2